MTLSKEQNAQLLSAGFTQRQINTMSFKFSHLLNTVALPEPAHLQNIAALERQLKAAIDFTPAEVVMGAVSKFLQRPLTTIERIDLGMFLGMMKSNGERK